VGVPTWRLAGGAAAAAFLVTAPAASAPVGVPTSADSARTLDAVAGVAVQPDGKIVAAGSSQAADSSSEFALARYLPNGRLDRSFGASGRVLTGFGPNGRATASSVALQRDGKIVVAGTAGHAFAVARYRPNGTLDRSFGAGGRVLTRFGQRWADASSIAIQRDGKIVVAGSSAGLFALVRYRRDGSLDRSFGDRGRVLTRFGSGDFWRASALVLQRDGRMVAAGGQDLGMGIRSNAMARYLPNGRLDPSFGVGGELTLTLTTSSSLYMDGGPIAVVIQRDGKIVAAGVGADRYNSQAEVAVFRLLRSGRASTRRSARAVTF
jgi:uncharacterized delta-60 repeat protein